jgi:3-deoxy-D-manno-octulosonate 8-phosphate phosphatase (KDO 8-P phosphatase)
MVDELARRARRVKLVLTDCDGVLTDTGVYYSERGEELKRFSIRDGMGVELLRKQGIVTGIVTGENSGSLARRAEKLQIQHLYLGIKDKLALLDTIARDTGIQPEHMAYIGDDVNDLAIINAIAERGLTCAPADALPSIAKVVHYRCQAKGGYGAFRDFADWLIELRARTDLVDE